MEQICILYCILNYINLLIHIVVFRPYNLWINVLIIHISHKKYFYALWFQAGCQAVLVNLISQERFKGFSSSFPQMNPHFRSHCSLMCATLVKAKNPQLRSKPLCRSKVKVAVSRHLLSTMYRGVLSILAQTYIWTWSNYTVYWDFF